MSPRQRRDPSTQGRGRQLRAVFLIRSLDIGGAQRQLIELASGLHNADWRVKVLVFYGGGELETDLIERGVSVETLAKRGRWDLLGFAFRLLLVLRRERPDVLHGYLGTGNLLCAAMKPLVRKMRVVWGVRASNMDLDAYDWLSRLDFRLGCWLARFADLVICNSSAGKEFHVAHGYPSNRMVVIPNGIDTERFSPDSASRSATRRSWAVDDGHILVGMIGRLDPMKDHDTFLRAAAVVGRDRPELRFVCVGDGPGPFRDGLKALAYDLGLDERLMWTGPRIDMPTVYSALDLVVLSSRWGEGFPNVVAEAMATAVPCIVTDVGDAPKVVGDTGWVCSPGDPADLALAIDTATVSRRALATRGRQARQRIRSEFSVDRMVQTTSHSLAALAKRIA